MFSFQFVSQRLKKFPNFQIAMILVFECFSRGSLTHNIKLNWDGKLIMNLVSRFDFFNEVTFGED